MKLKIEVPGHERMASTGSSLLRSFQNESLPALDLIVREAIQNSLDAAKPGAEFVGVDFTIGEFDSQSFNDCFESVGPQLNRRYDGRTCKYLCVKDYNTVGLTGKLHYKQVKDNVFGNLQKLIYEISKPQTEHGAGGSWGLGKTVYFRVGIGLVVYYSRVLDEDGRYASRLAASLVEDETRPDGFIQYPDPTAIKRGIAWWGREFEGNSTCPVTDETTIREFLGKIGVTPYSGTQTGTTIIIPYIDEAKLLGGIAPSDDMAAGNQHYYWLNDAGTYLELAVQRWYAPRMSAKYQRGPYLKTRVNGKLLGRDDFAPYFKIVQQLYENTTEPLRFRKGAQVVDGVEYFCQEVHTRNVLTHQTIGHVSFAKVSEIDLCMTAPDNAPAPYAFAGKYDIDDRSVSHPILCYIRKPGMVVSYVTTGDWLDGVPPTKPGEFVVALFVLNSENEVKNYPDKSLEQYVRKGEKSDHTAWYDWAYSEKQSYIVSRIKSNTAKILKKTFTQSVETAAGRGHSGLEGVLGGLLLPPDGFGKRANGPSGSNSSSPGTNGSRGGKGKGKNSHFDVIDTHYLDDRIEVMFALRTGSSSEPVLLELKVPMEKGALSADQWESDSVIGTSFPLEIVGFELQKTRIKLDEKTKNSYDVNKQLSVSYELSKKHRIPYGVRIIEKSKKNTMFMGTLVFKREDCEISGALSLTTARD